MNVIHSERWTELTSKGIYEKGKDRAVELDLLDDGGTGEGEERVGENKQSGNALS